MKAAWDSVVMSTLSNTQKYMFRNLCNHARTFATCTHHEDFLGYIRSIV